MDRLALRETLFANLERLGFDKTRAQAEHSIIFHKNMFQNANVKAMEILVCFLFSHILAPDQFAKEFGDIWPVQNVQQARKFKTVVHSLLISLEKQKQIHEELARLSLLHTCSGDKFYELLHKLSELALAARPSRTELKKPDSPSEKKEIIEKSAKIEVTEVHAPPPAAEPPKPKLDPRLQAAGNDFLKRMIDPSARQSGSSRPVVAPLPEIPVMPVQIQRKSNSPPAAAPAPHFEPKSIKKVHFQPSPNGGAPQTAPPKTPGPRPAQQKGSILKKPNSNTLQIPEAIQIVPKQKSPVAAVLRFSDEEESSTEEEFDNIELKSEDGREIQAPPPPLPSQASSHPASLLEEMENRPTLDHSRFKAFQPPTFEDISNNSVVPQSPMRTPSKSGLRKTLLPAFSKVLENSKAEELRGTSPTKQLAPTIAHPSEVDTFTTPVKARPFAASFASPSRVEAMWTPASERKRREGSTSLLPSIALAAVEAKFIDEECSLTSDEETEVDPDALVEGASAIINSPVIEETRRPFYLEWDDNLDRLVEQVSTAKKLQAQTKLTSEAKREGDLIKLPKMLQFSAVEDDLEELGDLDGDLDLADDLAFSGEAPSLDDLSFDDELMLSQ